MGRAGVGSAAVTRFLCRNERLKTAAVWVGQNISGRKNLPSSPVRPNRAGPKAGSKVGGIGVASRVQSEERVGGTILGRLIAGGSTHAGANSLVPFGR
jgi:hypothetical protein